MGGNHAMQTCECIALMSYFHISALTSDVRLLHLTIVCDVCVGSVVYVVIRGPFVTQISRRCHVPHWAIHNNGEHRQMRLVLLNCLFERVNDSLVSYLTCASRWVYVVKRGPLVTQTSRPCHVPHWAVHNGEHRQMRLELLNCLF